MKSYNKVGIILALSFYSCISDAPRINPLDSAQRNGYKISGKVERFYTTNWIEGAILTLKPDRIIVGSAMDGTFTIDNNLQNGIYTLICRANGFDKDSLSFNLKQDTTINFKLNALPVFSNISITTRHEKSFVTPDDYFVELFVSVNDGDSNASPNEVQTVWFQLDNNGQNDTLLKVSSQTEQLFFKQLKPRDFGDSTLTQLIGKPFVFFAQDAPGSVVNSNPQFMTRIIEEIPQTISPIGQTTIPFNFQWQQVVQPFTFTYSIEIFLNIPINLEPVDIINGIFSDSTAFKYSNTVLQEGQDYFWVLYIVDEFGNRSRSQQKALSIGGTSILMN